ncbi:hypothetical protein CERZMDRAFT_93734 [Cercospora zeae-maydis SCOH1-5]|uniref:Uncharacterized protein n=1 Tax=Cercospora zeae-maydis SCOH1-5 TaxID=717836 RepID=A0A6A6FST1_9PEZI|nr:hypothetical protein CERZMDRAFT_93734 [Cercospora zeae-maydis SCOH1-5]
MSLPPTTTTTITTTSASRSEASGDPLLQLEALSVHLETLLAHSHPILPCERHDPMAAYQKAQIRLPAAMPATPARQSKPGVAYRRPQCTHTTMNRVRGVDCSVCGRVPDCGWVYQCRQDCAPRKEESVPSWNSTPSDADNGDSLAVKARIAEHLKMSPGLITGIRAGDYSTSQVDKLIAQKENVLRAIREQEERSQRSQLMPPANAIIATAGMSPTAPAKQMSSDRRDSAATSPSTAPSKCNYAICAGCRPYFSDRLWASFETMFHEQPQITAAEAAGLPMINPFIARTIGLRSASANTLRAVPSQYSSDVSDTEADSTVSVDWSATNSGDSDAGGSGNIEPLPCPGPLLCPVFSRNFGCAYENEGFDDGKRAENHSMTPENSRNQLSNYTYLAPSTPGAASTAASSVSLPSTPTASSLPLLALEESPTTTRESPLEKGHGATPITPQPGDKHRNPKTAVTGSNDKLKTDLDDRGGVAFTH